MDEVTHSVNHTLYLCPICGQRVTEFVWRVWDKYCCSQQHGREYNLRRVE